MKKSTMIRNTLLASPIILIGLTGCGGGGGDSSTDEPPLSKISGVWNASTTIGDEVDVVYVVFKDYGEVITYDYIGDSYDQGEDCYLKYSEAITDLGDGSFEIVSDYSDNIILNMTLSGDNIIGTLFYEESPYGEFTLFKTSQEESNFSPLCNDIPASYSSAQSVPPIKQSGMFGVINQNLTIR